MIIILCLSLNAFSSICTTINDYIMIWTTINGIDQDIYLVHGQATNLGMGTGLTIESIDANVTCLPDLCHIL